MRIRTVRSLTAGLVLAVAGLGLAACDDDSTGLDDDHFEPVEMRLVIGGQTIVTATFTSVSGHLDVEVGEETPHIDVRFYDEDGDLLTPGPEYSLGVEVDDGTIAEFEQDTPGEFGGHFKGLSEGRTDLTFSILHGDHADWVSAAVEGHVEAHGG